MIPEETVIMIIKDSESDTLNNTFERLKTPKLIEGYLTKNFSYVEPQTVNLLGGGTFQYVPITKTLDKILTDKSFKKHRKVFRLSDESHDPCGLLEDFDDGLLHKQSPFFLSNPDALRFDTFDKKRYICSVLAKLDFRLFLASWIHIRFWPFLNGSGSIVPCLSYVPSLHSFLF